MRIGIKKSAVFLFILGCTASCLFLTAHADPMEKKDDTISVTSSDGKSHSVSIGQSTFYHNGHFNKGGLFKADSADGQISITTASGPLGVYSNGTIKLEQEGQQAIDYVNQGTYSTPLELEGKLHKKTLGVYIATWGQVIIPSVSGSSGTSTYSLYGGSCIYW